MDKVAQDKPRITLRQLASHLAGIGRDYPPTETEDWPVSTIPRERMQPSTENKSELTYAPTYEAVMKAVSKYPLVNVPYEYPIYSNTGMSLLGLANVAANQMGNASALNEPQSHKELLKRDIFDPLQMKSSFFNIPNDEELRSHIAVPSVNTEYVDIPFGDVLDPAGGQYSSLGDLAMVMQTILSPTGRGGVISANVVREWLRPLFSFSSVSEEVGAPWEIIPSLYDVKAYTKGGNLPGYHSEFVVIPEYSIGIILLVTGEYSDTRTILKEVSKRFIPTLRKLHYAEIERRYAGTWVNGEDIAEVELKKGALMLKKLYINGVDVLKSIHDTLSAQTAHRNVQQMESTPSVALWSTGRAGEFRLAFGRPNLNKVKDVGCFPYWASFDIALHSRGAPIDLVYWRRGVFTYPSAGVSLDRKK
ncbi:beta-lactamase/transpeptidase-like protein [Pholiota conissans]|uniref:Beta-lactamase/transpeptidase-like protein n=1 Tax=Pholiota conissans TaxID=109636 RepID=A0A9P6D1C6_9AGAR|nr:beta-lactamase/transpeptidase-like protein [Pholiota conissans]